MPIPLLVINLIEFCLQMVQGFLRISLVNNYFLYGLNAKLVCKGYRSPFI